LDPIIPDMDAPEEEGHGTLVQVKLSKREEEEMSAMIYLLVAKEKMLIMEETRAEEGIQM